MTPIMARSSSTGSLHLLFLLFLIVSFNYGGNLKVVATGPEYWCVARPSASEGELNSNIEFVCNVLGDCKIIQPGGLCYEPNSLMNHASVMMNRYYAANGRNEWNCNFSGSALLVVTDPSCGNCKYE